MNNTLVIRYGEKQLNISKVEGEEYYRFNRVSMPCNFPDMLEFILDYIGIIDGWAKHKIYINLHLNEFAYTIPKYNGAYFRENISRFIRRYIRLLDEVSKSENKYNLNVETIQVQTPKLFCIMYNVYGVDHDGYCTDAEANEEDYEKWVETEYVVSYRNLDRLKDTSEFNRVDDGCTSNGSGYCDGFQQEYTVNNISRIKDEQFHIEGLIVKQLDEQ